MRASSIEDYLKRHELWELTSVGAATLDAVAAVLGAVDESGALQRTMFRQIRSALDQLDTAIETADAAGVYLQLRDLDLAIAELAANAREFYATINRIAREERLDEHVFVRYKDQLIVYLQSFHDDLVRHRSIISDQLVRIDTDHREAMMALAEAGDDSIGLFGNRADWAGRWDGMLDWFVGGRSARTEVEALGAATTVAIRELLTLLRRLTEQSTRPVNRASELRETAAWFARCESDDEARCGARDGRSGGIDYRPMTSTSHCVRSRPALCRVRRAHGANAAMNGRGPRRGQGWWQACGRHGGVLVASPRLAHAGQVNWDRALVTAGRT